MFTSGLRLIVVCAVLSGVFNLFAQQQTNTRCTLYGNTADCTSDTVDYAAQQRQSYEAGRQIGTALGRGIALAMQSHSFKKEMSKQAKEFCAQYPGEEWQTTRDSDGKVVASGSCPKPENERDRAVREFAAHQKEYKPTFANAKALTAYVTDHNLNPRERKSYEHAFKDLSKQGKLDGYARL